MAYALADCPVGLLAWYEQIYRGVLDDDLVLATVEAYWLTGTVASSLLLFHEVAGSARRPARTRVPVGLARFPDADPSIRSDAERHHADIVACTTTATVTASRPTPLLPRSWLTSVRSSASCVDASAARVLARS